MYDGIFSNDAASLLLTPELYQKQTLNNEAKLKAEVITLEQELARL